MSTFSGPNPGGLPGLAGREALIRISVDGLYTISRASSGWVYRWQEYVKNHVPSDRRANWRPLLGNGNWALIPITPGGSPASNSRFSSLMSAYLSSSEALKTEGFSPIPES